MFRIFSIVIILLIAVSLYIIYNITTRTETHPQKEHFLTKEPIFMYWEQGWDNAPYICKMCMQSWIKYNGDQFDIIPIDHTNIDAYIPEDALVQIRRIRKLKHITNSSDMVRINLLANHSGFWIDASIMCTAPIRTYFDKIQTVYKFWCPMDINGQYHSGNFMYCQKGNDLLPKIARYINNHFKQLSDNDIEQMKFLYVVSVIYRAFAMHIDWNVIRRTQLSSSYTRSRSGWKIIANSKTLLLKDITNETKLKLNNELFLKLTVHFGIHRYTSFPKRSTIQYLINKHCV